MGHQYFVRVFLMLLICMTAHQGLADQDKNAATASDDGVLADQNSTQPLASNITGDDDSKSNSSKHQGFDFKSYWKKRILKQVFGINNASLVDWDSSESESESSSSSESESYEQEDREKLKAVLYLWLEYKLTLPKENETETEKMNRKMKLALLKLLVKKEIYDSDDIDLFGKRRKRDIRDLLQILEMKDDKLSTILKGGKKEDMRLTFSLDDDDDDVNKKLNEMMRELLPLVENDKSKNEGVEKAMMKMLLSRGRRDAQDQDQKREQAKEMDQQSQESWKEKYGQGQDQGQGSQEVELELDSNDQTEPEKELDEKDVYEWIAVHLMTRGNDTEVDLESLKFSLLFGKDSGESSYSAEEKREKAMELLKDAVDDARKSFQQKIGGKEMEKEEYYD